jgi:ankyrin repeat protein
VVELLLARGARIGARDAEGDTALDLARRAGRDAVAERLRDEASRRSLLGRL